MLKIWVVKAMLRVTAAAAISLLVAFSASAQTVRYVHTDGLGSVVLTTDKDRNIVERSEYEPYGSLLNRPLTDGPGYTGHVMDTATGLAYMQQRYYDPTIGRSLSVDPVTAYENPVGMFNRYWYANNNPYRFTDPDGRQSWSNTGTANPWPAVQQACGGSNSCEQEVAIDLTKMEAKIAFTAYGGTTLPGLVRVIAAPFVRRLVSEQIRHTIPEDRAGHIFRDASGHLKDNPQNREMLRRVADDPKTTLGTDRHGNTWSAQLNKDGSQTWTQTRSGEIRNGGVNEIPKQYNPETGLSRLVRPSGEK